MKQKTFYMEDVDLFSYTELNITWTVCLSQGGWGCSIGLSQPSILVVEKAIPINDIMRLFRVKRRENERKGREQNVSKDQYTKKIGKKWEVTREMRKIAQRKSVA